MPFCSIALVPPAGGEEDPDRGRAQPRHRLDGDPEPVRQLVDLDASSHRLPPDHVLDRLDVVRAPASPAPAGASGRPAGAAAPGGRRRPPRPRRGTSPGARWRAPPSAPPGRRAADARGVEADGGVRADDHAGRAPGRGDRRRGSPPRRRGRCRTRPAAAPSAPCDSAKPPPAPSSPISAATAAPFAVVELEEQPLEVRADLDVHRRADRRRDGSARGARRSRASGAGCRSGWWRSPAARSAAPCASRRSRRRRRRSCRSAP